MAFGIHLSSLTYFSFFQITEKIRKLTAARKLRMGMKKSTANGKNGKNGKSACGKSGKSATSSEISIRPVEDGLIGLALCPGSCMQDSGTTAPPLIAACNAALPAQQWDIVETGAPLPILQIQANSGLCIGIDPADCAGNILNGSGERDITMLPCTDPRTEWISFIGNTFQSWYCWNTVVSTPGSPPWGVYLDTSGDYTCDVVDTADDDQNYGPGTFVFDQCQAAAL